MPDPRHVKAGVFWRLTCGIDTDIKNAAKFNTPWNHFTPDHILVCSVWRTDIVPIADSQAGGAVRRFVQMGNVDAGWSPTLKRKGREAADRLASARANDRRVVGFELEPRRNSRDPQEQLIDFFYLERPYELGRIFESADDFVRLKVAEEFKARGWGPSSVAGSTPGYYFELLPVDQPVPGWSSAPPALRALLEPGFRPESAQNPPPDSSVHGSSTSSLTNPLPPDPGPAPSATPATAPAAPPAGVGQGGWGGGEGESHLALKAYVSANPGLVNVPADAQAIPEFLLKSADRIDVVFQTPKAWVAVEVKSNVSGFDDHERGIFQVVKYRAVLEAMAALEARPRKVRVLLALQGRLPDSLRPAAAKFDCEVVERVEPTAEFLAARAAAALVVLAAGPTTTMSVLATVPAEVSGTLRPAVALPHTE